MRAGTVSAGLLLYRTRGGVIEVFLVHPGGPFWTKKDLGAWTVPKGECAPHEELLACARREFKEETSFVPTGPFRALPPLKQAGGKRVYVWAVPGDCDPTRVRSTTFTMEWPPRSGRRREFAEVDRAAWYPVDEARRRILPSQAVVLDELERLLSRGDSGD